MPVQCTCLLCGSAFIRYPSNVGLFCSRKCLSESGLRRVGHRGPRKRRPLPDRFWPKVDQSGGGEACWLWTAGKIPTGYGRFCINGRYVYAHRVAWELTHGQIEGGLFVLHDCPTGDNPSCVNPAHLFLGTQSDNMKDCYQKGRNVFIRVNAERQRRDDGG